MAASEILVLPTRMPNISFSPQSPMSLLSNPHCSRMSGRARSATATFQRQCHRQGKLLAAALIEPGLLLEPFAELRVLVRHARADRIDPERQQVEHRQDRAGDDQLRRDEARKADIAGEGGEKITSAMIQSGSRSREIQENSLVPAISGALRGVVTIAITSPAMMMLERKLCATVSVNGALDT